MDTIFEIITVWVLPKNGYSYNSGLNKVCSDEGLTLETSAFQFVTVTNLNFQLSWYNQITLNKVYPGNAKFP